MLSEESLKPLVRLCINVLYPCLIFDKVGKTDILSHLDTMWLAAVIGYLTVLIPFGLGVLFSWLSPRLTGLDDADKRHTFVVSASLYNYGYLPIPILLLLFPENPEIMSLMFLFTMGVELSVWTVAVPCLAGGIRKGWWKNMLTMPLIAVLAAIGLNLAGGYAWIPQCVATTITWIGQAYLSIPLIIVGAFVLQELLRVRSHLDRGLKRNLFWLLIFRGAVFPALVLCAATLFPGKPLLQQILVIQAGMPTAMLMVMFTQMYGGNNTFATWSVVLTNFLSPVTAILWIAVGMRWIAA